MKFGKSVCIINVGGTKYAFPKDVIKDFPLRRVSRLHSCASEREVLEVCDDYDRERNEFFFDRHSEAFGFIMLYVKYGKLRFVPHMCELSFYNEMIYWGLESSQLEFCCQRRLDDRMSDTYTHFTEEDHDEFKASDEVSNRADAKRDSKWLERMRRTFEEPTSSVAAQILASVSVLFVIVSMVLLCASTLPDWKTAESNIEEHWYTDSLEHPSGYLYILSCLNLLSGFKFILYEISTVLLNTFLGMSHRKRFCGAVRCSGTERVALQMQFLSFKRLTPFSHTRKTAKRLSQNRPIIEAVCIGWFTAEFIVRFIVSRDKCEFVRRPLNIIDFLAITPYYISVTMTVFTGENSQLQRAGVTLRVLRMMRIFWVIKLARHFLGLQTLGLTLRRCYREMVMLLVFICVAMAIFGALAQLLEHGLDLESGNEDYASIPGACWWVIISMTTVGYGDMYPITVPGRVLGGLCVVSGIVLLALPITFIYHSFVQCYHELKYRSTRCTKSLSTEFIN
ncbi:Potassium voltage-gated channel subfamily G member 3 [Triplophysa tibetana]|uniref:Potassium voltage-gated channel subfamily G member 3 n=1 Tax=Triplophysa tibetana TaxID=1572043 RepID=A0A5A9P934_9TELE|nr:Potassium voltage-gated channel subfamily G member 3 [Triplophysa tibetana]